MFLERDQRKIAPNGGIYGEIIVPAVAALDGLVEKDNPEITLTYTGRANDGTEVNGNYGKHSLQESIP